VKKVEALIRTSALRDVIEALERLDVGGVTVSDASCGGARLRASYRGASYVVDTVPGLRIEVVSTDAYAGPIAWAIATAARTGQPGDGVVSIETVDDALRIRTGERGSAAVSARVEVENVAPPSPGPSARTAAPHHAGFAHWSWMGWVRRPR
jgi:nitrogen regulatory protein P-II 1